MTNEEKLSLIDLLESYKPDGNYYDGYHNFSRRVDEAVCNCLDNVIAEIKQIPTSNAWIKCSEKMPENGKRVLVVTENNGYSWIDIGYIDEAGYWTIDGEIWDKKSDPAITRWMLIPIPPLETL